MLITNFDALEAASTISFIVNVQGKPWVAGSKRIFFGAWHKTVTRGKGVSLLKEGGRVNLV